MSDQADNSQNLASTPTEEQLPSTVKDDSRADDTPNQAQHIMATSNASGVTMRRHPTITMPSLAANDGWSTRSGPTDGPGHDIREDDTDPRGNMQSRLAAAENQNIQLQQQLAHTLMVLGHVSRSNAGGISPVMMNPLDSMNIYHQTTNVASASPPNMRNDTGATTPRAASMPRDGIALSQTQYHSSHSAPVIQSVGTLPGPSQLGQVDCRSQAGSQQSSWLGSRTVQQHTYSEIAPALQRFDDTNYSGYSQECTLFNTMLRQYDGIHQRDAKCEFWPALYHRTLSFVGDPSLASHVLHAILDESSAHDIIRMRCFPAFLHAKVRDELSRRQVQPMQQVTAQLSTEQSGVAPGGLVPTMLTRYAGAQIPTPITAAPALVTQFPQLNMHLPVVNPTTRNLSTSACIDELRAPSLAGFSSNHPPSSEVEDVIKHLLSGRLQDAAAGIHDIQKASDSLPPMLPKRDMSKDGMEAMQMLSASLNAFSEQATRLFANKDRTTDEYSNAEKVKFSSFKNAGTQAGFTTVETILWQWETEFASAGIPPKVSRVLGLMTAGGNLSAWKDTYRSATQDINDPDDIRNWSWERFRKELFDSTLYSPPDKKKLHDTFAGVKCQEPGTPEQITAYTNSFMLALQNLRLHHIDKMFSPQQQAQMYYNGLTEVVRQHMSLMDPKRADPEIRENLTEVREEVRAVAAWNVFRKAVEKAPPGRTIGGSAVGAIQKGERIEPRDGEQVKFAVATANTEAWLKANAARYHCRHRMNKWGTIHILVGTPGQLTALLSNHDAVAAGLVLRPPRNRQQQQRDAQVPTHSNPSAPVAAQGVQTVDLPSAPRDVSTGSVSTPDSHVPADSSSPGLTSPASAVSAASTASQPTVEPANTPKGYTYHSNLGPSSNAYHGGRARGLVMVFRPCDGKRTPMSDTPCPLDVKVPNHQDVFFDCLDYEATDGLDVGKPYEEDIFYDCVEFEETRADEVYSDTVEPRAHVACNLPHTRPTITSHVRSAACHIPMAARLARAGRTCLQSLKLLATYEMLGVLRPLSNASTMYTPIRQIRKFLILIVMLLIFNTTCTAALYAHQLQSNANTIRCFDSTRAETCRFTLSKAGGM